MLRPDRVSLVIPPMTTIENTRPVQPASHQVTCRVAAAPPATSGGTAAAAAFRVAS